MGNTKKVGSAGRFGSRYGVGIRKRLLKVEDKQKEAKECPHCGSDSVKRENKGIFLCKKCGFEFVGGAYFPQTLTGKTISKIVSQKKFATSTTELAPVSEEKEETKAKEVKDKAKKHSKPKAVKAKVEETEVIEEAIEEEAKEAE